MRSLPFDPRRVLLVVGAISGLGAILVAFTGYAPPGAALVAALVQTPSLVIMLAFVIGVLGLRESYEATERQSVEPPFDPAPETPTDHDGTLVGGRVDESYDQVTDPDADVSTREYKRHRARIQRSLRDAAVEALIDAEGVSLERARERVDDGSWTDDPRAAAFLGGDVPRLPLSTRLQDWLSGRYDQRRIDATVAAIGGLADVPETETADRSVGGSADSTGERGGGVEAGGLDLTDDSIRESVAVTAADATDSDTTGWDLGVVVAFLLTGTGFVFQRTTLVLGAVVALGYAVYGHATRPPSMAVEVTRVVADASPVPGEPVEVRLTVENIGDRPISEMRVVDGVPEDLPVFDGTPRGCTSLQPGESTTVTYAVEALRGDHEFGPATVWTRNVSGEIERETTVDLPASLRCRDPIESVPLTGQTTPFTGRIPTDTGGQGVEFYATREYQSTDPLSQIDWNFWARTGEPRTIEFRQNQAATVVVLLDDRELSRRSRHDWSPDAVSLGRYAAVRMAEGLLGESNAVGAATLSGSRYERPGRGSQQLQRIESLLYTVDTDDENDVEAEGAEFAGGRRFNSLTGPDQGQFGLSGGQTGGYAGDGGVPTEWLRKRLPGDAQVVFVTPLLDEQPSYVARRLQAEGNDVTVVSPDVTTSETPGATIRRIKRYERLRRLRRRQFRVVDWPTESPLSVALERAQHRWSQ